MPWWVVAYLVLLTLVIMFELLKDFREHRALIYLVGETASGVIGWTLVFVYFTPTLIPQLGWFVLPLLVYSFAWDQYALLQMKKSAYADLSEEENDDMDKYSKFFAFLFIAPCYLSGGLISWQLINLQSVAS